MSDDTRVLEIGTDLTLPEGYTPGQVSDGYHTFAELYDHRVINFLAVLALAAKCGLKDIGWSYRHSDGHLCFGGGWVIAWITAPSGLQARYHICYNLALPAQLERPIAPAWNGVEETLAALLEIAAL